MFVFCGCNAAKQPSQQPDQQTESKIKFESAASLPDIPRQNVKSVIAPVAVSKFLYSNALKFESPKLSLNDSVQNEMFHYMTISGLADKEVENKINKKIYDESVALYNKGLPPYRGIRVIATEDKDIAVSMLYVTTPSNMANILSVYIQKDITIQNQKKEQYYYITDVTTLNFNLKNGELIALSDLFADNCDYKKLINDQVSKYILSKNIDGGDAGRNSYDEMGMGSLKVISPFSGISENQKYYISGENISIIVDYNMPEFDTNYIAMPILIDSKNPDIAKNLALFTRFETYDESL
jgi:hypothetical protein